jgi:hypothetical protein
VRNDTESLAGTGLPRYALPLAVTSLGTLQLTDTRPRGQEGSMLVQEEPLLKLMQLAHLPNDALLCQENGSVRYKRYSDRKSHDVLARVEFDARGYPRIPPTTDRVSV